VILSDSTPANAVNFSARASAEYVCVATYWCAKREEDRAVARKWAERREGRWWTGPRLL